MDLMHWYLSMPIQKSHFVGFLPQKTHQSLLEVRDACSPGRASDPDQYTHRYKPLPGDLMAGLGRTELFFFAR